MSGFVGIEHDFLDVEVVVAREPCSVPFLAAADNLRVLVMLVSVSASTSPVDLLLHGPVTQYEPGELPDDNEYSYRRREAEEF